MAAAAAISGGTSRKGGINNSSRPELPAQLMPRSADLPSLSSLLRTLNIQQPWDPNDVKASRQCEIPVNVLCRLLQQVGRTHVLKVLANCGLERRATTTVRSGRA